MTNIAPFLHAPTADPELADKLRLYGQFVGSWKICSSWWDPQGGRRSAEGEWHFGWILGGMGVQDVLFRTGAAPRTYGTTVRCYDASRDVWHLTWMQPGGGEFVSLLGRRDGDRIVQEGSDPDSGRRERWTFNDITATSFLWRGEASVDGGAHWRLEQEMEARRITR